MQREDRGVARASQLAGSGSVRRPKAATRVRLVGWLLLVPAVLLLPLLSVRGDLPETVLNLTPHDRNRLLRKLAWRRPAPDGVAVTSATGDNGW